MDSEPLEGSKQKVTLRRGRLIEFGGRRFTPADLVAIDEACPPSLFQDREWQVKDELGTHSGTNIRDVLDAVIWESVAGFRFMAIGRDAQSLLAGGVTVRAEGREGSLYESFVHDMDLPARQRVSRKIEAALVNLPVASNAHVFTTDREPAAALSPIEKAETTGEARAVTERRRKWWDLRRKPESLLDWIFLTAAGGLAVVVVVAVVVAAILN